MVRLKRALWSTRLAAMQGPLQHLQDLRRWASFSEAQVERLQAERLADMLEHAYRHVPYYREVLGQAGVVDETGVILERFDRVPLLDKDVIRKRFDELRSDNLDDRKISVNTSGGSTGEPVRFVQDADKHHWNLAVSMLFDEWAGTKPGDRRVILWGAQRDLEASRPSLVTRASTWLRNEIQFDAFLMTPAQMREYVQRFNDFRPQHLLAYAQSLFQWATFIEAEGLNIRKPNSIITAATTLEPHMRTTIERVFRTRVINRYGSREVGGIACEVGDGQGLAISALTHYVEVIGPDGRPAEPGQLGELVVTLLTNRAMPLIRYRIGDAGVPALKATSKPFWPRLEAVAGRVTDIFYTAAGAQVYGGYFTTLFYHREWVSQFQVVQEDYDRIRISIVPVKAAISQGLLDQQKRELTAKIREAMGTDCRIEFEMVDSIQPGPSGKRRYTISKVGPPAP